MGEKPRFSASAPISAAAPSSSLARNTTLLPPCTAGSWARTAATKWLKPLTSYMDSPCVARASSLLDSGSDCGRYIRPLVASVEAGPDDNSLAGASRLPRCLSHQIGRAHV